jgi:NAD(P)-dependent dehydrogenase (short-subunit alcohol dehydrogenase family)
VNLGLDGRVAFLVGAEERIRGVCADLLRREGARVVTQWTGEAVDIVVASGRPRPGSAIFELGSVQELRADWGALTAAVTAYRAALPGMRERRWGRLVWIGSAQAKSLDAAADELDVVVSLGMMGLHKVVASEEGPRNVTANAVLRGGSATDEDVANVVAFMCSEGAAYLTGVTITVDGGAGSAMF